MYRRRAAFTPDRWRLLRHVYYRLVEKVDAQIGQILTALREIGQEENTLVVFTSDHGDMAGAHELNQKHSLYDKSARIPLIVAGPGVAAGHVVDEPVSHADVLPTLCDLAQVDPPAGIPGVSLRPAVEGRPFEREPVVVEFGVGRRGQQRHRHRGALHRHPPPQVRAPRLGGEPRAALRSRRRPGGAGQPRHRGAPPGAGR